MASANIKFTKTGDKRYVVRYRDPNQKTREKWFTRKAAADRFARNIETDIDRGVYLDPGGTRIIFSRIADAWMKTRTDKARSTLDRDSSYLRSMILPTFGDRQIGSVRPSEVEQWIANLDRADRSRIKALQILDSIFDLARKDGLIAHNPAADVRRPKINADPSGKALTDNQLAEVIEAAETIDRTTAAMILVMARCGLRIGEAIALRRSDIDFASGRLVVSSSMSRSEGLRPVKGRAKGDPGRDIPMPIDVQNRLREHISEQSVVNLSGFLFTAPEGGPIRYENWSRRTLPKIVERVGFKFTSHDLRRTTGNRLFLVDRWTPPEVQAYLGHRDPRTTLKFYTRISARQLNPPSEFRRVQ